MKRFAALGMVLVLVLAIAVASIGCSCNESIGPTPQPDISTPTPQPETATPTPTPTFPPEEEYDTTRDTMQNAVTVYVENHGGSHPPKVGDITINQEVRYIFDICSLLEANGGTLTQIPDCMASVDGDNNDNFDLGDCRLGLEGFYIWAIDEQGNIYSACIGSGCSAQYEDGYQRLSAPQLGSPLNGANISDNTPLLTWSSVDGATGYVIQVTTDPGFGAASMIIDNTLGNVQTYEIGNELANGTYFWHVKGINACTESLWSEMGLFNLDYSSPPTGCTLETALSLVAPWADMESKSMKNDVIVSFGEQSFSSTTWQKGDRLIRIEVNGSTSEWPEGAVWLVNMSSSLSYYYYPAESRAEITCISPSGFSTPLLMAYWLASPDAQLENCSFSCETYNDTECLVIQFPEDFDNTRLWIEMSSGLPVSMQIEEEEVGVITYDYRNFDLSDIPDSMFQLPEGTTISGEDPSCSEAYGSPTPVPTCEGSGIAVAGTFSGHHYEVSQGGSVNDPGVYFVVFNNGNQSLSINAVVSPSGANIVLSDSNFLLPACGQQQVTVGIEASDDAICGDYGIEITIQAYLDTQLMGSMVQTATFTIVP